MKKVLITGSNGFIGRNLTEKLQEQYNIYSPSRSELNLLDSEGVKKYLLDNKFDVVIHCATQNASRNAKESLDVVLYRNLRMFFNLERCRSYYEKMYYFGSGAEYDMNSYIPGMEEEFFDKHVPNDAYGFSKYVMAKTAMNSNNIYNLRLFGVYGRYEDWEIRFISNAICKALYDMSITIKQNVYFDYLYINDLADIMKYFIENVPKYKEYNLCTGLKIDLMTIAHCINKSLNKNLEIIVKKNGLKREYSGCNHRLLNEIGNYNFTSIKDGINELIQYYRSEKDKIDAELLKIDK